MNAALLRLADAIVAGDVQAQIDADEALMDDPIVLQPEDHDVLVHHLHETSGPAEMRVAAAEQALTEFQAEAV